jgi:hypothetical protein
MLRLALTWALVDILIVLLYLLVRHKVVPLSYWSDFLIGGAIFGSLTGVILDWKIDDDKHGRCTDI